MQCHGRSVPLIQLWALGLYCSLGYFSPHEGCKNVGVEPLWAVLSMTRRWWWSTKIRFQWVQSSPNNTELLNAVILQLNLRLGWCSISSYFIYAALYIQWIWKLRSELVLPQSMTDVFWNFGIACEIKLDKLPKYLGRWSTPKTRGSHFGPIIIRI